MSVRPHRPHLEALEDRLALTGLASFGGTGHDTRAAALDLGTVTRDVSRTSLVLDGGADWFRFQTRAAGGTNDRVAVQSASAGTALELSVYDAAGTFVGGTGGRAVDHASARLLDLPAGTYYAAVTAAGGVTGIRYSLSIDAPVVVSPLDDRYRDNDTADKATSLGSVNRKAVAVAGRLPRGDEDWYSFRLAAAGSAGGRVLVSAPGGWHADMNLELYDGGGNLLDATSGPSGVHGLSLEGQAAGTYRVRVSTDGDRGAGAYRLTVSPKGSAPAAPLADAAFYAKMRDAQLRTLVQADMIDGQLSREDWVGAGGLFSAVEQDGKVSANEFQSLKLVLQPNGPVVMDGYVANLAGKVVNGDYANATYQGAKLGNLRAGSSAGQLGKLVDKWFLGLDRPAAGGEFAYREAASNPLFGPNGPELGDINQGDTGDCYFLSSVGTVLSRQLTPASGVSAYFGLYDAQANPDGMFIDNGDGTWTVRFHYKSQATGGWVPDYVTVDRYFPTTGSGGDVLWNYANAYQDFDDATLPLWVALAEKAYVQQSASGRWVSSADRSSLRNDYQNVSGLYDGNQSLMQITGRGGYQNTTDLSGLTFQDIVAAYEGGVGVVFGTMSAPPIDPTRTVHGNSTVVEHPLVTNHDYMMVGYDAAAGTVTLRNPWGESNLSGTYDSANPPASANRTDLLIEATVAFLQQNFNGYYHINPKLIGP